jgi:hypothetical protein
MSEFSGWLLTFIRAALAVSLYVFLGLGLWIIWQDLRSQSKQIIKRLRPPISIKFLSVVELPEDEQLFTQQQVFIGRDPSCECMIPHETVSSRHSRIFYEQGQWWLEDMESRNGTFLNQNPVDTATVLTSGDEVRCGEVIFNVFIEKPVGEKNQR